MDHQLSIKRLFIATERASRELVALGEWVRLNETPTPADTHALAGIATRLDQEVKLTLAQVEEWAYHKGASN